MRSLLAAIALAALSLPAGAAERCYVPYGEFEEAVKHVDLASCPENRLKQGEGFCRLALEGQTAHLYQFRFKGEEACLERIEAFAWPDFVKRFGVSYTSD
jgi:hypothetical protein